jgi:hypothetical protein
VVLYKKGQNQNSETQKIQEIIKFLKGTNIKKISPRSTNGHIATNTLFNPTLGE